MAARSPEHVFIKHSRKDVFVIGFALFSMFFGAGNVIFPPYLGLGCGRQWFLGFACYYLADIGLALAALFAVLRAGSTEGITRRIGKVLTPVLLIGLLVLIVKGVMAPIGPVPDRVLVDNVPITGIEAGYQTMDVLAAIVFGIILKSARDKGYTEPKAQAQVVAGAGIVLFAVVVALACITTAVALVSSAASYSSKLSGGRLRYTWLVAANLGLDQIVSVAAPILSIVYLPTLVLIGLSFFDRRIASDWVFRMAALGALVFSLLETAASFGLSLPFLERLPLASLGWWVIPAAVCGVLGALWGRRSCQEFFAL